MSTTDAGDDALRGAGKITTRVRPGPALWTTSLRWTTATGLVCAVGLWGWFPSVVSALVIALIAALWTWLLWPDGQPRTVRRSVDDGGFAGLTVTGLVALVAALGVAGLAMVLMLGCTAPVLRSQLRSQLWARWFPERSPSRPVVSTSPAGDPSVIEEPRLAGAPVSLPENCDTLDDAQLVMAWRRSFVQLQMAACEADRLDAVDTRQRCLDELYRRHPTGMAAWLAAGARASGDPTRYIDGQRPGG